MTDTHKDLVKKLRHCQSMLELGGYILESPYHGMCGQAADTIERLTASAPVDGDLREAFAIEIWRAESIKATGRDRTVSWEESGNEKHKDGYRFIADRLLALLPARTPEADAAPRQGMELWRPDWFEVMKGCAFPVENHLHANELVSVTRETARLSLGALSNIMAQDYYHNHGAAAEELKHVLGEKQ